MPTTFTSGNDSFTVKSAGIYDLDFLAGDDTLTVDGGDSTTAHMGVGDDLARLITGLASVFGDAGADRFEIWASDATVDGGADNDTINLRGGGSQIGHGGLGADRFNIFADAVGISLFGDDGNDVFFGYNHQVSGTINGGLGNDVFYRFVTGTTLAGGGGNDIYRATTGNIATFQENPGEGVDAVQVARGQNYTLPDNIENISIQGFAGSTTAAATLNGNALANAIITHNNAETIHGFDGNDRISAQGGNDVVFGGNGSDLLVGGSGMDNLFGEAGNDTLRGAGAASMFGGSGDDLFYVDSADDIVTEHFGEGTDTVRTFINNYALPSDVENGIIQNTGVGMTLTGNELNNQLTGNKGDDELFGGEGDDILSGGAGNDLLDGLNGVDTLIGGTGNDTYNVYQTFDTVTESSGQGVDTVNLYTTGYTLGANVENLNVIYIGAPTATVDGNALDNVLTGTLTADTFHGHDGNDTLNGGDGTDVLWGEGGNDILNGGLDFDQFSGGDGNDIINGGSGVDLMAGNAGADTLSGGSGNDVFYIFAATESAPGSADQITDFFSLNGEGADDQIDLASIDADTGTAGDQAFSALFASPTAHGVWSTETINGDGSWDYVMFGDVNGDAVADFELHFHSINGGLFTDDITW